ncbi:protein TRC8 homolog [Tribolium castaneum]|uniref:Protein TRC8 homolog-like Protein n=1 Tax=Tribolium castaneum TaxID=7070 RepID=D6WZZ4_TRICA|nr:PREDICTED: protein TRC8 homolog [Tribolium castaneum]EFA10501.1 Protein TRC8 homolog-like Protein [Tribolium castaneum]|eukprot:XP_008198316.1 PREDICTED: protein TRC8 homolog [Tribolium castaneum]
MSFRSRVLGLVEVVLRVPPLFVIDEILKFGIGLEELSEHDLSNFQERYDKFEETFQGNSTTIAYDPVLYKFILVSVLRLLLSTLGCAAALCLFILNIKHLMVAYMYIMSVGVVFVSYWSNASTIKSVSILLEDFQNGSSILDSILSLNIEHLTKNGSITLQIFQNYVLQCFLSFIFINIHLGPRYSTLQKILPFAFLAPSMLSILPVPSSLLNHMPVFSALLPLALVKFVLWSSVVPIIQTLYNGYTHARTFVSNFGMSALVETEWTRLNVPEVLRTFWMLRVLEHAGIFFASGYWDLEDDHTPYFRLMKYLLVTGCDTLTAVLGITSIVSYVCNYIGKFFQWLLLSDDENDKNFGTVSAIVFYILALQTGLTGLEPEIRFVRLCRNFCLLFTAILHFVHNVVNPLLMSLSASHNPSLRRHLHALLVCLVLVLLPLLLMYYLWSTQDTSTWLLAVSAFSIEVIVKVFVSLAIYSLFLLDARRETFWEKLDDYIYYIRAFGNTVEFCFGIFLFFNGAWILLFESGSAIRAVMMCIHAYFNIWCDAKAGWSVFMKRRTAVNKIESLPEAEEEQLRRLDDVCAICYQEMRSAKITRCKHFFHGVCLRKWLYVQDRCPLCHEILHGMDCDERKQNQPRPTDQEEENNYDR